MKLATFTAGAAPELGLVQGEWIVPVSRARRSLDPGTASDQLGVDGGVGWRQGSD